MTWFFDFSGEKPWWETPRYIIDYTDYTISIKLIQKIYHIFFNSTNFHQFSKKIAKFYSIYRASKKTYPQTPLNHPKKNTGPSPIPCVMPQPVTPAWSETSRTSQALTTEPMAFEVPMALSPATPQPRTKVCAGGYLPRSLRENEVIHEKKYNWAV